MAHNKNYQVIRSQSLEAVEEKVNALILKGWSPTGGIYVETIGTVFSQAMTRPAPRMEYR